MTTIGDLSSWIFRLHGLETEQAGNELRLRSSSELDIASSMKWMEQIAGPESDPRATKSIIAKIEGVNDHRTAGELTSLYHQDKKRFHSEFKQQARKVADAAEIPKELEAISGFTSFEESLKTLRASRVLVLCLSVHKTHPLSLIARAAKGDRRAVLDHVKIDKLFLHDQCTRNSIRKAELQNDRAFSKQLVRAQMFVPKLSAREMQHLYFYQLFLMEHAGTPVPTQHDLWRILDPRGSEYRSLSSFERDFQRRRRAFDQMLNDVSAEIKDAKL